ncbi:L-histidine N(alpha)-methyltransferase [Streptomyces canus]|uniref:L-histidine N(alpha)-methyltransferase n=1 Tax=Streptomyces canus TaxID=58343 RepID=UPI0033DC517E
MPDAIWAVSRLPPDLSRGPGRAPVSTPLWKFTTRHQRFAHARLSDPYLTRSLPRLFPLRSPRPALNRRSQRWFGASPCRATPEDLPPSLTQHRFQKLLHQRLLQRSWHTTCAFSKNVLTVLNREFDGDFDLAAFDHIVLWDSDNQWIEMRLRSRHRQTVTLRGLGLVVTFAAGEDLRTEISAKFEPDRLAAEVRGAGLEISQLWTEPTHHYGLALISPAPDRAVDAVSSRFGEEAG